MSYKCGDHAGRWWRYQVPRTYLGVRDGRQRVVDTRGLGRHGQQCGDTERHPGRYSVGVEPERHPGHDDQHAARNVDLDQVVGELALEQQVHLQARVLACDGHEFVLYGQRQKRLCIFRPAIMRLWDRRQRRRRRSRSRSGSFIDEMNRKRQGDR